MSPGKSVQTAEKKKKEPNQVSNFDIAWLEFWFNFASTALRIRCKCVCCFAVASSGSDLHMPLHESTGHIAR